MKVLRLPYTGSTSQRSQLFTRQYSPNATANDTTKDAVNDTIAKQNFPKFRLRSTTSLFKL